MSEGASHEEDKKRNWFRLISQYILTPYVAVIIVVGLIVVLIINFFAQDLENLFIEVIAETIIYIVAFSLGLMLQSRGLLGGTRGAVSGELDLVSEGASRHYMSRSKYDLEKKKWKYITSHMVKESDVSYNFLSIKDYYRVDVNGNTSVRQEYLIEVLSDTLQYFRINMSGDKHSRKIYDLGDETEFSVKSSKTGMDVEFIATQDDPLEKQVTLFLLPRASRGDQFLITINYNWPELMKDLSAVGEAKFNWDYDALNPTKSCDLLIQMDFDVEWGPLSCQRAHEEEPHETLTYDDTQQGLLRFVYRNEEADVARDRYSLLFQRVGG